MRIGETDRISLERFYPLLAILADAGSSMRGYAQPHFALASPIINDPNPTTVPFPLPNGELGKPVVVDDHK